MDARNRWFYIMNAILGVLFVISAILQYNDPDALPWILIWASAGAVCVLFHRAPTSWFPPALVGGVALIWTLLLAPAAIPGFRVTDLAKKMKAETPAIELSREMLGLLMIVVWMAVLALYALATRRRLAGSDQ